MTRLGFLGSSPPRAWSEACVSDVTSKVGSGATPRGGSAVYQESGTAFIRSQNVHDHEFRFDGLVYLSDASAQQLKGVTVSSGDVLINITGDSILRTCVVPDDVLPARVSQHVAIVRSNGLVDPGFLQKWLSLPAMKDFMIGHSAGGTRKAITKAHLLSFPLPLPLIAEQQTIAATLGALDDKIESNRRLASDSLRVVDHIVDAAGRNILTRVPLQTIAEVNQEMVNPASFSGEVDHFSIPAFDSGSLPERISADLIRSGKQLLRKPSIMLSRLNPRFNRTWWTGPVSDVPALASTEFLILGAPDEIGLARIWTAVRDKQFMDEFARRVTGTSGSHQRIRPADAMSITVPDVRMLVEVEAQRVAALVKLAHERRIESRRLVALRDALLPELVSGRIRAREAEGVIEEVTT